LTLAAIFGCSGPVVTASEAAFFREVSPFGFILFRRNVETPDQVRALVSALRDTVGRADAPIMIDQEGGRVQRLGPPHWPVYPPGRAYGAVKSYDPLLASAFARLGARLMADDLHRLGINVDAVPVLDVPQPGAHDVIGDRAYGTTAEIIATLGRAAAEGLLAGGVLPIIKHIPGHGRAMADSHLNLPVVEASLTDLSQVDFAPFRSLSDMPMAMTAHVIYTAVDPRRPATTSRRVIRQVIRDDIGFDGLLMSDDLSMKALSGTFAERTRQSLAAGCDVVLHCNGDMDEMVEIAGATRALAGRARMRAAAALARIPRSVEPLDAALGRERFRQLMASAT
jgi:beta-N-acetylhexosaminidase